MGVNKLQSFMENQPPGPCRPVAIREMANEFRHSKQGKVPVIVVDAANLLGVMYGDLSRDEGGQWREYLQKVKDFVDAFHSAGIELVFFCDTCVADDKREEWCSRRKKEQEDVAKYFNEFSSNVPRPKTDSNVLPPGITIFQSLLMSAAAPNSKCIVSRRECDQDIAQYAVEHDCLAILAQDTDYVIFDTVPLLSRDHLNLQTLETVMYDRNQLAINLELKVSHLPLLSCLLGNDIVSKTGLVPFHHHLCRNKRYQQKDWGPPWKFFIPAVVKFMRKHGIHVGSTTNIEDVLSQICRDIFGLYPGLEFGELVDLMQNGINFYSMGQLQQEMPRKPVLNVPKDVEVLLRNSTTKLNGVVYGGVHYYATALEYKESNTFDLEYSVLLYLPIRSRIYYLLQGAKSQSMMQSVVELFSYPGKGLNISEIVHPLPCKGKSLLVSYYTVIGES